MDETNEIKSERTKETHKEIYKLLHKQRKNYRTIKTHEIKKGVST